MSESTLTQFGHVFQAKIITSLLVEQKFLQTICDILKSSYFDSDANKWLVGTIIGYFLEYKTSPTLDVMKVRIDEMDNEILQVSVVDNLKESWRNRESTDLKFVQEQTIEFCRNQVIKQAIMDSVDLLEVGQYDQIKKIVDEAMKAGSDRDLGHVYIEGIEERLTKSTRDTIATGWDPIDEVMDGGLGKGELGVVVAPAGIGKTWVLSAMGAYAISQKLNVVHYTLELNEAYVGLRYDSIFSGFEGQNLKYHKEEVMERIFKLDGKLTIKYYPTKSCTVNTLSAHLKKAMTFGEEINMVIVDYADIMRDVHKTREMRHALGNIYEDLRGMAGEFQIPIWTASQANRSALDEDVIEASRVAESYAKVMTADFVMSLSRKIEDKIGNTGRFHVIKNRFGPDGLTYPARINTNIGKIELFESTSIQGKDVQHKIKNRDNQTKQILSQRYDDLMKGEEIDN